MPRPICLGLNWSYTTEKSNLRGREKNEVTLLGDINHGRPPLMVPDEDDSASE